MRLETPSVKYKLFDESSKKLAKQKGKASKASEVKSEVKQEVHKVNAAKQAKWGK